MRFVLRLILLVASGVLAAWLAHRGIRIWQVNGAPDFKFAGTLLAGLSFVFLIFDLFFKGADAALTAIKFEKGLREDQRARVEAEILGSRRAMMATTAVSIAVKALSGICGGLLVSALLAPSHYEPVFLLGYFLLGTGLPLIVIAFITSRHLERAALDSARHEREVAAREELLKSINESPVHDFGSDETVKKFGRIIQPQ